MALARRSSYIGCIVRTSSDAGGWETAGASPGTGKRVMPQFFFDVSGETVEPDLDGVELADLDVARSQAIRFTGEMLQHSAHAICDGHSLRVEVSDAGRIPLFAVTVSAISIFPGT